MAAIEVKYDPTLELEPVVDLMYSTTEDPDGRPGEVEQTKMTGIFAPLIRVNDLTINWSQVRRFKLTCDGILPTVSMEIEDNLGLSKTLDHPKADNIVRVEILPAFDEAYKKVDLRFYITDYSTSESTINLTCTYNVPALFQNRLEAFGQITTYELCDKIAKESGLGLASNVSAINDKRYMYCKNQSLIDLLSQEIVRSGTQSVIPEAWVNWHNYLIISDTYDRYKNPEKGLKVWTMPNRQIDIESGTVIQPKEEDAIITNAPYAMSSQLYCDDYRITNDTSNNITDGTDKVIEIYDYDKHESSSVLIQDGDVHKDTFVKVEYRGEAFAGSQFQLQECCRHSVLQKIYSQCIVVELESPLLALERGERVDLRWYDSSDISLSAKEANDINTTADVPKEENLEKERMNLNKQVTGQYLILSTVLSFEGDGAADLRWRYRLLLGRPADEIKTYGNDNK